MTDEEVQALTIEKAQLSKQQERAILTAVYARLTKEEIEMYDPRHARILEITQLLSKPRGLTGPTELIKQMQELIERSKRLAKTHDSILREYAALKAELERVQKRKGKTDK